MISRGDFEAEKAVDREWFRLRGGKGTSSGVGPTAGGRTPVILTLRKRVGTKVR